MYVCITGENGGIWQIQMPSEGVRIELGDVTQHNVRQLRLINRLVFPVIYNDRFYEDVLHCGPLAKLGILF